LRDEVPTILVALENRMLGNRRVARTTLQQDGFEFGWVSVLTLQWRLLGKSASKGPNLDSRFNATRNCRLVFLLEI
jgi:hypothetical protein